VVAETLCVLLLISELTPNRGGVDGTRDTGVLQFRYRLVTGLHIHFAV
jgi:hypothetical protein